MTISRSKKAPPNSRFQVTSALTRRRALTGALYRPTMSTWTSWAPFPDPRKKKFLVAPLGPGATARQLLVWGSDMIPSFPARKTAWWPLKPYEGHAPFAGTPEAFLAQVLPFLARCQGVNRMRKSSAPVSLALGFKCVLT